MLQIAIGAKSPQFPQTPQAANGLRNALKNQGLRLSEPTAISRNARFTAWSIHLTVIFDYKLASILTASN
ncbi:hypothetical protein [Paraburkholderia aromaticivorans]|uniref:hypothetical protein n=1 Tax=Paraburkholderia aromaticivorans TaxID=2026199 RepID=UPI001455EE7C|nr:hypothetical protein [Paraburkholderia aromaticivorans]